MHQTRKRSFEQIAKEVKQLHDLDERLDKDRLKNLREQRDTRLQVGRLASQVTELGDLAERSGYSRAKLKNYRQVAQAWPEGSFPSSATFTALNELKARPDRFELIKQAIEMSGEEEKGQKRNARQLKGGKVDTPSRWRPSDKAKFIAEALDDPEVANDKQVRKAMNRVQVRGIERMSDERRATVPRDDLDELQAHLEAGRCIRDARRDVGRALEWLKDATLGEESKDDLLERVAALEGATELLRSSIESGDRSFEDQLAELLAGGDPR